MVVNKACRLKLKSLRGELFPSDFTIFCKLCHRESIKYDSNLFGLIYVYFELDSDFDLNKYFPTFIPKYKS